MPGCTRAAQTGCHFHGCRSLSPSTHSQLALGLAAHSQSHQSCYHALKPVGSCRAATLGSNPQVGVGKDVFNPKARLALLAQSIPPFPLIKESCLHYNTRQSVKTLPGCVFHYHMPASTLWPYISKSEHPTSQSQQAWGRHWGQKVKVIQTWLYLRTR